MKNKRKEPERKKAREPTKKKNMPKIPRKTAALFERILHMVAPPPVLSVTEWADSYRFIPDEYGAEPGRWDSSRAPYQKPIMDAFTTMGVHKVIAMLSAQLGKSEILFNVIGRFIHLDPCPMLMVQPTLTDAQDWSKERLTPTIENTPVLHERIYDQKSRKSENTILKKLFPGGYLALVGSNAPSGLAKRSIRVLLFDEVDRFDRSAGTEGDPVDLGIKRTSNFWNYLIGLFSTPTDAASRIYREYMLGSQEEWRYKCPNCGEWHWLTIWNMKYEFDEFEVDGHKSYRVDSVKWCCPDCGYRYTEAEMRAAEQGYIAQNPNITDVRSFHVNAFTSPWLSWKQIVAEYLAARHDPESMKTFINTRLAELYKPVGELKNIDILLKRRETYTAEIPDGVLVLTAAVDTQDNRLEYEIAGWGRDEERWGIKKGVILGRPDNPDTWGRLDEQLDRRYSFSDGRRIKVACTFIDHGGHYSDKVYQYCQENMYKQRYAIQGAHEFGVPILFKMAKAKGFPSLPVYMLGVNDGKQYIIQRLKDVTAPGPEYSHFPDDDRRGYDKAYFKGLLSEQLEKKIVKGRLVQVWKNIAADKRNEPIDLQIYNLACLRAINPDWSVYEALLSENGQEPVNGKAAGKAENSNDEKTVYGCISRGI